MKGTSMSIIYAEGRKNLMYQHIPPSSLQGIRYCYDTFSASFCLI